MNSLHASPERSSPDILNSQFIALESNSYLKELFNALPYVVAILNKDRQIVFSNQVLVDTLKVSDFKELLGKRPGEALHCIHSKTMEAGCGTSENCRVCGAVNTITTSMKENRKVVNECRITSDNDGIEEFFDYEVAASPFKWQGEKYTVFSIADISGIKRKRMLERIFFHDILNTAGNLKGLSELVLQLEESKKRDELLSLVGKISNELVEEILEQRQISAAETGELQITNSMVNTHEILESLVAQFEGQIKKPIQLVIADGSQNLSFSSDKSLLTRILKNMVKNALEASSDGDTISIKANVINVSIRFTIHSQNFIPRDIQLQIFKRSFSTKGFDRGLGTYSMKLLGERFLKGKVHFKSDEKSGTDFYFDLPLGS
jgi:K+-sensing histidine kinase KdpD